MSPVNTVMRPASIAARWVVGAVFVYLGLFKVLDPVGFLKLIHPFGVLQAPWLNLTAAVLPWFEIFCGALLILGVKPRAAALVQVVLLVGFTAVVLARAYAIYRAGGTQFCAIHFDCGCGTGDILICTKLLENVSLLVLAGLVVFRPSRALCVWPDE